MWLWFTVVFANFAEAMAEGRGKAQADTLRRARRDVQAKKLSRPQHGAPFTTVSAGTLRQGDVVVVEAGEFIPSDGEVLEGIASVDESAITGRVPRSSARAVATAVRSPAARVCSPIGWWCVSR